MILLVPDPGHLTATDRRCLSDLARHGVITAALGPDLPTPPAPGVRGGPTADASLHGQWSVIALGPGVASAMLARRTGQDEFEFAVTHDRNRVIAAATSILRHIGPG